MRRYFDSRDRSDQPPGAFTIVGLVLALLCWLGWLVWQGQHRDPLPINTPGLHPAAHAQAPMDCLSYAPFRRPGHAPWKRGQDITRQQLEEDLRLLRPLTNCVRTYGVDQGLAQVPDVARDLGMRVWLGVWIGRDDHVNRQQLDLGLALARAHADVVEVLIVGNEVLLRREQSPEGLAHWLAQAQAASAVPVSYADVWEFWQRHAATLSPHVDLVAAHILPYWEDEPVAVADAIAHVHDIAAQLEAQFAPLPVWIAETGWPAAGRQRGPAVPGVAEQSRFVRELLARPLPRYNLIEAFDQPWKRALEGAMGGHWGMLDAKGELRIVLDGSQTVDPLTPLLWTWTGLGALLGAALGAALGAWRGALLAALCGGWLAPLAWLQWQMLHTWSRSPLEWGVGGLYALLALSSAVLAAAWLAAHGRSRLCAVIWRAMGWLSLALLFATVWMALTLLVDGRYRPLLWPMLWAPVGLLLLLPKRPRHWPGARPQARLLAFVGVCAAAALVWQESGLNTQAVATALLWCGLAVAVWRQIGWRGYTASRP